MDVEAQERDRVKRSPHTPDDLRAADRARDLDIPSIAPRKKRPTS